MMHSIKKAITHLLRQSIIHRYRRNYEHFFTTSAHKIHTFDTSRKLPSDVEKHWLQRYQELDSRANIKALRLFSHYVNDFDAILPYDTYQCFIGPALNPVRFNDFYGDKNNLDIILPKAYTPDTILRRIDGTFLDKDYAVLPNLNLEEIYKIFQPYHTLIIKPSYRSYGGQSVKKILKKDDEWTINGHILSLKELLEYNDNYIIQNIIEQSDYISQFCTTSVNSFRIVTYRSVSDNQIFILASVLRIGHNGSVTDNISTGGKATRINEDGTLGTDLFDYYGNLSHEINNIDFDKKTFTIPNYDLIIDFAKKVAKHFVHSHVLALDIALDKNNKPILIEVNLRGFSIDIPYFAHFNMFGDRTEEVIDYALMHKNSTLTQFPV